MPLCQLRPQHMHLSFTRSRGMRNSALRTESQVVSQEEHIHTLIDKIGGDDAAVLKSARVDANDGKKVATTSDAAALQTKVKKAMTSRAAKKNLAAEDRKLLQRELRQQVRNNLTHAPRALCRNVHRMNQ